MSSDVTWSAWIAQKAEVNRKRFTPKLLGQKAYVILLLNASIRRRRVSRWLEPNAIKHPSGSPSIPISLRLHVASEREDAGPGSLGILVLYAAFSSMVS